MARGCIVIATLLGVLMALTSRAVAQAFPPCTDLGPNPPSISAFDLDDNTHTSGFTATHTLRFFLDEGSAPFPTPDESAIQWSLPPGTTEIPAAGAVGKRLDLSPIRVALFADNGGALPISASWPHDDGLTQCTVTVATTIRVQAATPIRLSNPNRRNRLKNLPGWDLRAIFGPHSDLRPVQILRRGVRRAQLPGAGVPFRTYNAALRAGDPGWDEGIDHILKIPRFQIDVKADNRFLDLNGETRGGLRERPLGYEVKVVQAGRQVGDLRIAGKCGVLSCTNRIVRVQR